MEKLLRLHVRSPHMPPLNSSARPEVGEDVIKEILRDATALHKWRVEYNGEHLGLGIDPYRSERPFDYPDAYAAWGQGYLRLYELLGGDEYIRYALEAARWLMRNSYASPGTYAWGLPWEYRGVPARTPCAITTSLVGEFFLKLYDLTGMEEYLNVARGAADWLLRENGFEEFEYGICFNYSPAIKECIYNASARATSFLLGLSVRSGEPLYYTLVGKSMDFLMKSQNLDGSWSYCPKRNLIDNVHTGILLESLWRCYLEGRSRELIDSLILGTDYYWRRLYDSSGFGFEKVTFLTGNPYLRFVSMRMKPLRRFIETRLWGYAFGIKCFALAGLLDARYLKCALNIYDYVASRLRRACGCFGYKRDDPNCYIRHEAFLFDALTFLASALHDTGKSEISHGGDSHGSLPDSPHI